MHIFHFCRFVFFRLWTTLARKLMKKPAVFITYFQSPFQFVHVYQFLHFEDFFEKFDGCFNLTAFFLRFATKLMKRPNNFMTHFQSFYCYLHTHKFSSSENIFQKIGSPLKMLTIFY